ncbi:MAG: beta-ketoacyl-ACP reductase [Alphaproteobacteria bacterium]|nr:beta-ketoacyl-ACP reductase [Alphaproteobacteria bacterium]MBF68798.1 beta-ketoacyl-ACP reductase [Gammaproteobacteria bacterium]OUT39803.1 MAG: beta-ketoacyl-ACP reductase [Micavibrio sp. TMED2]MAS48606.1 beta-ketoacyl-ACP reductase [Alphaproteobacteria bacterium]MAX96135.1 beta-ketoacyl-ACP reductase [Alphaproteobacteria bacterium]
MSRVAVVTGGTRGIGADIAIKLKADGYKVAANYAGNDEKAAKFKADTGIDVFKFDVADFDSVAKGIDEVASSLGPVEVLVNNAGITRDGMLHKMDIDAWQAVIDTNLTSCFNLCRAVVPAMREAGFGRIVNISSINGQKGQMGQTNYSAAKAGMIGFTKALAQEGAFKGITANVICPGYIATEMTGAMKQEVLDSIIKQIPVGRMGKPEEIADMVAYLVRDDSAFITGATFSVNGGQYMV